MITSCQISSIVPISSALRLRWIATCIVHILHMAKMMHAGDDCAKLLPCASQLSYNNDRTRTSCTHERTCAAAANALTNWASQTDNGDHPNAWLTYCLNKCPLSRRLNWWNDVVILAIIGRLFQNFGAGPRQARAAVAVSVGGIFSSALATNLIKFLTWTTYFWK